MILYQNNFLNFFFFPVIPMQQTTLEDVFRVDKTKKYFCTICGSTKVRQRLNHKKRENYCTNCNSTSILNVKKW